VPADDARLEQALHDAAPDVTTSGVVTQVGRRRTRRRRNRRLASGALAIVLLLVVSAVTVLATRDDTSSPHVTSPTGRLQARVITAHGPVDGNTGSRSTPTQVVLDQDPKLLRAPLLAGSIGLSTASYDPGIQGVAVSHLVRIDGTKVYDVVTFQATHVLSIAEGEGARWALTQNNEPTGGRIPDTFLKRIPASNAYMSTTLPQNTDPVGPIAAVGGAVWIPVRDGVVQYDATGTFVRKVPLADADHRWVAQVGKFAYATDGNQLAPLDVSGAKGDPITYGPEILGLASINLDGRVLLAGEDSAAEHARVARAQRVTGSPVQVTATLPDGFLADGLSASTTRMWATGTVDGSPAIALLTDDGVGATVVLEHASPGSALAWTSAHTVSAVSDGKLFDITIP
jgi:hypothetical protein